MHSQKRGLFHQREHYDSKGNEKSADEIIEEKIEQFGVRISTDGIPDHAIRQQDPGNGQNCNNQTVQQNPKKIRHLYGIPDVRPSGMHGKGQKVCHLVRGFQGNGNGEIKRQKDEQAAETEKYSQPPIDIGFFLLDSCFYHICTSLFLSTLV
jgi:hypothetical protein